MKLILLLSGFAIFGFSASAQDAKPLRQVKPLHFLEQSGAMQGTINHTTPIKKHPVHGIRMAIDAIEIGTATNALSTLQGENNMVSTDNNLHTVVFIHRNDITANTPPYTSSQYRYAISTDGGANFTTNVGPLNPLADGEIGGINARYPQCVIYNPAGNTDPNNAWLPYIGTWHDGSANEDTWQGLVSGVVRLNGNLSTATEHNDIMNNGNVTIAASMCQGAPGEFWAVDNENSGGTDDTMVIVYKGILDTATDDISWSVFTKVNPGYDPNNDSTFTLTPVIAFDPTGQYGWIASCADVYGEGSYTPYFFKTVDSGATWTGPYHVDLDQFPIVMDSLSVDGSLVPTTAFDVDLGVDIYGNPHLATVIGSATSHAIQSGLTLHMYDITYNSNSSSFEVWHVAKISALRGVIGYTSTGAEYTQDNRPQVTTNPDGSKVMIFWSDSPQNVGGDNSLPDLMGTGVNLIDSTWTYVTNFTIGDNSWGGQTYFPSLSPHSFHSGTLNNIPVVVTRLNVSNVSEDPASFHYFRNINFEDADFKLTSPTVGINTITKNDIHLNVYPNPANDMITVTGLKLENAEVKIVNVLGETINVFANGGNNVIRIKATNMSPGIYTLQVTANGVNSSRSFVVQR